MSALVVVRAPTPPLSVARFDTSGTYPQVSVLGDGLRRVNAALRGAVLADQRSYAAYARRDWLSDCARIACPVLVIAGSEDRFPTVAMSRRVAATIPGARLAVIPGGGHFPNRTHRAQVQAEMARFLDEIGV